MEIITKRILSKAHIALNNEYKLNIMPITAQVKRLIIVYNDYLKDNPEGNQTTFAKLFDMSQGHMSKVMKGEEHVSRRITDVVCLQMGYSPSWFIGGEGDKRAKKDAKMVTEIQMLRGELEILRNELRMMQARMRSYEDHENRVKNRV